ncbi:MAG TPA: winged helix-turn-helix domain-containing protein [Blastocatellia bacterium]|nr:winged helix-turn-helix domain-containing protein [Blastocatellia bacterium]
MQPKVSADEIIRFGEFEIALKSGELRKNGQIVRLQPQPFKVLAFLALHAGQTVTRQEVQQAVWEDGTFVDFEHGLNFCIKQIRSALGDDAQSPRLVETLPRRGYRFIAEVETLNGSTVSEPVVGEPEVEKTVVESPPKRVKSAARRLALAFLTGVIAAALVIAGYFVWRNLNKVAPPVSRVMVAVLPFENLSGDADQDYFSDGMTEEMIAQLGRLHPQSLGVIARTSAMTYKGVNKDITRIGRELGVDFVVEGSVRREQDRVRITAQLIQVSDQTHLWSESYDRSAGDALKVQNEVAGQIAHALAIRLLTGKESESTHSASAEAVDAYLRGRYLWNKGGTGNVGRSVEYFQQAIEKDSTYAAAFAGMADSYRLLGMYYVMLPAEAYPKAREATMRAIKLDPGSADAYVSLGSIKFRYDWDWEEAERDFQRALEINPSLGMAHHDYAWFLVAMGRFDEGIDQIKLAQRLDPLSPLANSDVGWVYLMARRYDEAIEQINRTLDLEPTFGSALACLERAYTLKGQSREALETMLKEMGEDGASLRERNPAESMKLLYRKRLERTLGAMKAGLASPYNTATICMAAGKRNQALAFLERAYNERDPMLVAAKTDPVFDGLRADPRFADLLRRIAFPR